MNEAIQELKTVLEPLAKKLGQAGEHVFELAIKQNYVYAINDLLFVLFVGLLCIPFIKLVRYALETPEGGKGPRYKKTTGTYRDGDLTVVGTWAIVSGVFMAIFTLIALVCLFCAIGRIINPEWYAIENLIGLVIEGY